MRLSLLSAAVLVVAGFARADTVRLAVIVGNDSGSGVRGPLHYAQEDAAKVAQVLTELGGIKANDLYLLRGMTSDAVGDAFDRVRERIRQVHRANGMRAMLIFYFSGHSDGEALELGKDRLTFSDLRRRLSITGADLRVAIVDSCRSGALLAAKSGHLQAPFEIRLSDDLPTTGTVILTSSAANEDALESKEIKGSFFTHNLVSGLRGAADASGDGRITLAEAYRYAYSRTVAATARTLVGAQHPAYDMQLSGMGELVLTELARPTAGLFLPEGFDRALITEPFRDEVFAEVPGGSPRRIAVPPGDYLLRLWRGRSVFAGRELVEAGRTRLVAWTDLQPASLTPSGESKGDGPDLSTADLARGISIYNSLDNLAFEKAAILFRQLLMRDPPGQVAAKAHLYLGLIALNLFRPDETRTELELALRANPGIELPVGSSPKATLAFAEAQEALQKELQASRTELKLSAPPHATPETRVMEPSVEVTAQPVPPSGHRLHLASWALVSLAIAAGVVAVYGGVQVANYNGENSSRGKYSQATVEAAYPAAQTWGNVWWPVAIAGALAGGGAAFVW